MCRGTITTYRGRRSLLLLPFSKFTFDSGEPDMAISTQRHMIHMLGSLTLLDSDDVTLERERNRIAIEAAGYYSA